MLISGISLENDIGQEPLLLAHFSSDSSHVAIMSALGGLVLGSFLGPLGYVVGAWAAYNDITYTDRKEKGLLLGQDDGLPGKKVLPIAEPQEFLRSQPVEGPKADAAAFGLGSQSQNYKEAFDLDDLWPEPPEVLLVKRKQHFPELDDPFAIVDRHPMETPIAQAMAAVERRAVERQVRNTLPTPELDSAADLGQNPQSAIIAGVPGAGKGIFVSNALREMKVRNPHVKIFAIDPKNDPKETGYWSVADQLWRKDFDECSTEDAAVWLMDRINEYRAYRGSKLLVIDEGTTALTVLKLAKVYDERELGDGKSQSFRVDLLGEFKKFLVAISGMGDSRDAWIWIVCQVINCDDLGLTGGVRSIFRSIALVSPKNRNAVSTFFSTGFVPLPPGGKDALYRMMDTSPCNRAFYDGKTDKWLATPLWKNHSGYNRDTRTVEAQPMTTPAYPILGLLDPWGESAIANPQNTAFEASIEPVMGAV